jgi:hypothetical protein
MVLTIIALPLIQYKYKFPLYIRSLFYSQCSKVSAFRKKRLHFHYHVSLLSIWSTISLSDVYCVTLHARIISYAKAAWVNTDVTQPADLYLSVWLNLASVDCLKSMTFASSDITIIRIRFHRLVLCIFFIEANSFRLIASLNTPKRMRWFFFFVYKYLYNIWNEMKQNTEFRASTRFVTCRQKFKVISNCL